MAAPKEEAQLCTDPCVSGLTSPITLEFATTEPLKIPNVNGACNNCRKAKMRCCTSRPCKRCVELGKKDSCADVKSKKRGRKLRVGAPISLQVEKLETDPEMVSILREMTKRRKNNAAESIRRRKIADTVIILADLCAIKEEDRTRPRIINEAINKIQTLEAKLKDECKEHKDTLDMLADHITHLTRTKMALAESIGTIKLQSTTIEEQSKAVDEVTRRNNELRKDNETLKIVLRLCL